MSSVAKSALYRQLLKAHGEAVRVETPAIIAVDVPPTLIEAQAFPGNKWAVTCLNTITGKPIEPMRVCVGHNQARETIGVFMGKAS